MMWITFTETVKKKSNDKAAYLASLLVFVLLVLTSQIARAELTPQQQTELRSLLYQDCGSCHGLHLTGGLGPNITAKALEKKPAQYLFTVISEGRPGTPMPPWKSLLSQEQIQWIVDELKEPARP